MTLNLSAWIEEGSIRQHDCCLEGVLKFVHLKDPIFLKLIGRSQPPLENLSFYFWNNLPPSKHDFPISHLARTQAGAGFPIWLGPLEVSEEPDQQNPEPQYLAGRLRLEWCGQNGPLQIDLGNPTVEFLKGGAPCPAPAELLESSPPPPRPALAELLPRLLPTQPERRRYPESPLEEIRELDEACEGGHWPEVPLRTLFDPPYPIPDPARLSPEEIEIEIKVLLAQLARLGVCVDLCEHVRGRRLLEILIEDTLDQPIHVSQLIPIHGLEHMPTYSVCSRCQEEFEEEESWIAEAAGGKMRSA